MAIDVNRAAGSFKPPDNTLEKQFAVGETRVQIPSTLVNEAVTLKDQTVADLHRMGTLEVNHQIIYNNRDIPSAPSTISNDPAVKAGYIFDKYLAKFKNVGYNNQEDMERSIQVATASLDMIHQQISIDMMLRVMQEKGYYPQGELTTEKLEAYSIAYSVTEQYTNIDTDYKSGTFICEKENLVRIVDRNDLDLKTYFFKMKFIISGKLSNLEKMRGEKLNIIAVYTKEYPTAEEAKEAKYSPTWQTRFASGPVPLGTHIT
jgi:hypothetical protein